MSGRAVFTKKPVSGASEATEPAPAPRHLASGSEGGPKGEADAESVAKARAAFTQKKRRASP